MDEAEAESYIGIVSIFGHLPPPVRSKASVAARIASELARRGFPVTLTTTDPAAHVEQAARELSQGASQLKVTRIDPALETRRYTEEVLATAGSPLDAQGKALLAGGPAKSVYRGDCSLSGLC